MKPLTSPGCERPVEFTVPFSDSPSLVESTPLGYCAICTRATAVDSPDPGEPE